MVVQSHEIATMTIRCLGDDVTLTFEQLLGRASDLSTVVHDKHETHVTRRAPTPLEIST